MSAQGLQRSQPRAQRARSACTRFPTTPTSTRYRGTWLGLCSARRSFLHQSHNQRPNDVSCTCFGACAACSMALGLQPGLWGMHTQTRTPSPSLRALCQRQLSQRSGTQLWAVCTVVEAAAASANAVWPSNTVPKPDGQQFLFRSLRSVRRSRAQVKCWATIPVPDSQPVLTDLGWHTDFAQHYVKVGHGHVRGRGDTRVVQQLWGAPHWEVYGVDVGIPETKPPGQWAPPCAHPLQPTVCHAPLCSCLLRAGQAHRAGQLWQRVSGY